MTAVGGRPKLDEPLRLPQQVTLDYRFAAGEYASVFFRALVTGALVLFLGCFKWIR